MLNLKTPHTVKQGGTDIHLTMPSVTSLEDLAELSTATDPFSGTVMSEPLVITIWIKGAKLYFGQKAKESVKDSDRAAEIARFVQEDKPGHDALVARTVLAGDLKGYTAAITARVLANRTK